MLVTVILIIAGVLIMIGLTAIVIIRKYGDKLTRIRRRRQKKKVRNQFTGAVYAALNHIPIVTGLLAKTTLKVSRLSVYRAGDLQNQVVVFLAKAAVWSLLFILAGIFLFSDVVTKSLCFIFAFLIFGSILDKKIDSVNTKVLKQTKRLLSSIQQEYMRTRNIPDALAGADTPQLLRYAVDNIHDIVMGSEGEMKLQQFYSTVPFRPLQTLANICFNINTYGDTVDVNNESTFVRAITILRSDINAQIEKLAAQKSAFTALQYLPMIPVFFMTPLEMFFMSSMPGTALVYNGILCYIAKAVTLCMSIASYMIISRINSTVIVKPDDRGSLVSKLAGNKSWQKFVKPLYPKKVKSRKKWMHGFIRQCLRCDTSIYILKKLLLLYWLSLVH